MNFNVGIVIPIYNALPTLERSLNSITNQKNVQENIKITIFCVLNAMMNDEKDKHVEIINKVWQNMLVDPNYRNKNVKMDFQILCENEKGIVPALNAGLDEAKRIKCDYIFRQDADDEWHPEKLQKQLSFLQTNPEIDILGTGIAFTNSVTYEITGNLLYPEGDQDIKNFMLNGQNAVAHPSVAFRTKILKWVGGYDDSYPFAEDLSLWLRCIKHCKFHNLQEILVNYTQKPNPNYNPLSPQIAANNQLLALRYFR
jgi:hypothetical protein